MTAEPTRDYAAEADALLNVQASNPESAIVSHSRAHVLATLALAAELHAIRVAVIGLNDSIGRLGHTIRAGGRP